MIVSVTVDRNKGGIANSLVSYSKALHITGKKHLVMVPKNAHVISDLKELENVKILAINKISLYFHIYTKFFCLFLWTSKRFHDLVKRLVCAKVFFSLI